MINRLVLGCSGVGHAILDRTADWPGRVRVIAAERSRVTALREENVLAAEADPADPTAYPDDAQMVIVAGSDAGRNLKIARVAREAFPEAFVLAYTGVQVDPDVRTELDEVADRVIDPVEVLSDRILELSATEDAQRTRTLLSLLRGLDGRLAVVTHDNPDPDAIASAVALARIAESVGVEADACYYGEISHQENRALVNLLDIDLRQLSPEEDVSEYAGVALVDHSRPGVNDGLPAETEVDVVVDHHPPRAPVEARFVDLRSDAGATSTLLAGYLDQLGVGVDRRVATALLYGIRVDTRDFTREISEADFEAAAALTPYVDTTVLERVETPSMNADVFETLSRAIDNRELRGSALASCVGEIRDRDALAQAAERLLDMEGVRTTVVYGYMDGTVYLSGRARGAKLDLGETLRDALGQIGSAGGHADMAGAQIPLGILSDVSDDSKQTLTDVVRDIVAGRFFEALEDAPGAPDARRDGEFTRETETPASGPPTDGG